MSHRLREYLDQIEERGLLSLELDRASLPLDAEVSLVTCDSRKLQEGCLFICKGANFRLEYLQMAKEAGAIAYLSEQPYSQVELPWLGVRQVRPAMALCANLFYDRPWEALSLIGITGTKGKSTTTVFLKSILDADLKRRGEKPAGIISGIWAEDGKLSVPSHLTTPEPLELEEHLANAREAGLFYVAMEVSSQALKYDRVLDVQFDLAAFLNIDYDHISPKEHPTWEDYFASKLKIFHQCKTALVHLGTEHADRMLAEAKAAQEIISYSLTDPSADVYGYGIRRQEGKTLFRVCMGGEEYDFALCMLGDFNVSNALAAIAIAHHYGIAPESMAEGLLQARVKGRMEIFQSEDQRLVGLVDFAHNRLSFERLFAAVKEEFPKHKIAVVFGSTGEKAINRRQGMGQVAGEYADRIYLTEDDPGKEDPQKIAQEIASYIAPYGKSCQIILDREQAIARAFAEAKEPTVVIVAGRGDEKSMRRAKGAVLAPTDLELVQKYLKS